MSVGLRHGARSAWRFGAGAKAGYTSQRNVYAGVFFDSFIGHYDESSRYFNSKRRVAMGGGELGYDFWIASGLVLRPKLVLGYVHRHETGCYMDCYDRSRGGLLYGFSAEVLYGFLWVAPEIRIDNTTLGVGGVHVLLLNLGVRI